MTDKRKCNQCPTEYEPKYYNVLNANILVGAGHCPACAMKLYDSEQAKEEAAKEASIMGTRRRQRQESGIPNHFMNEDFSTFKKGRQDKAYEKCVAYAESFPADARPLGYPSLYIYSEKSWGVGKTHLSCAIGHRVLDRWKGKIELCPKVVFISEPDLFRNIQATYNFTPEEKRYRESEDDIIKSLTWCDLLLLDDVGKEKRDKKWNKKTKEYEEQTSAFVQRTLFAIINGRYDNELPIVLTANLDPEQLKRHLGEASFDRLFEQIKGRVVVMEGLSFRRK